MVIDSDLIAREVVGAGTPGLARVVGRESPNSLYSLAHVTFEEDQVYDQRDAEGFIRLNALRLRTLGQRRRKLKL